MSCSRVTTDFDAGVNPWEIPPTRPRMNGRVAHDAGNHGFVTVTGTRFASGETPTHLWAHGRVLLAAPIAEVWAALQWRPA